MVDNATLNNISVISSVLLVKETWLPGENHRPVASHWQTLSHNVVSGTPCHERTPLKTGDELRCSGRVSSSCSTSICIKAWIYQRRKTNNTNTKTKTNKKPKKNKQTNKRTMLYKTLLRITEIKRHEHDKNGGELRWCGREGISCSNSGTRHFLSWILSMSTIYYVEQKMQE